MTTWPEKNQHALQQHLTTIAREAPGHWSFAVREAGQVIAQVEAHRVTTPASTIKVAVLLMVLQDVAEDQLTLEQVLEVPEERVGGSGVLVHLPSVQRLTVAEVAEMMIVVSDNEATNMLIRLLGLDRIAQFLARWGMHDTQIQRTLMDTHLPGRNATTAADQALLLDALCADLLPPHLRTLALDMLLRQQFNSRMPARLGPDVLCRHKTGEIIGIRHDVGVLDFDDRMISFAALGSDLQDVIDDDGPGPVDDIVARAAATVVATARGSAN
ncbi:serine hydrolase [Pseudactinotalea sp. Z1739]|uniref:serine hydrolase n=1 Tax=Pseudactinotalea sp. Z1739 TaxID=3413028 RepID=UPI003C7CD751